MILGIGVDIIRNDRIERMVKRFGNKFLMRVFHKDELDYCLALHKPIPSLAARFALKEAFLKAIPNRTQSGIPLNHICLAGKSTGRKEFYVDERSIKKTGLPQSAKVDFSISHEQDFSIAYVIISTDETGMPIV